MGKHRMPGGWEDDCSELSVFFLLVFELWEQQQQKAMKVFFTQLKKKKKAFLGSNLKHMWRLLCLISFVLPYH